jgi:hypothetical protein
LPGLTRRTAINMVLLVLGNKHFANTEYFTLRFDQGVNGWE